MPQIGREQVHELSALAFKSIICNLKAEALPPIHWHSMLKGREWPASPQLNTEVV